MKWAAEERRVPGNMNGANRHARYFSLPALRPSSSYLSLSFSFSLLPIYIYITTAFLFLHRSTSEYVSSCTRLRACQPTHQRRRHRRLDIYDATMNQNRNLRHSRGPYSGVEQGPVCTVQCSPPKRRSIIQIYITSLFSHIFRFNLNSIQTRIFKNALFIKEKEKTKENAHISIFLWQMEYNGMKSKTVCSSATNVRIDRPIFGQKLSCNRTCIHVLRQKPRFESQSTVHTFFIPLKWKIIRAEI